MDCIVGSTKVSLETVTVGHCIEVEGSATTTYEGVYQLLCKPQLQKFVFHLVASGGNFMHTNMN